MIFIILGIILVLDAILSLLLVDDKKLLWQIGRIIRLLIGLYLIFGD